MAAIYAIPTGMNSSYITVNTHMVTTRSQPYTICIVTAIVNSDAYLQSQFSNKWQSMLYM